MFSGVHRRVLVCSAVIARRFATRPANKPWPAQFDVVVVGFGAAGASAALEAAGRNAKVLIVDRFVGGGSTAASQGVFYAGGGTAVQQALGIKDSPENMFKYLSKEVSDAVSSDVLKEFCDSSAANLAWLQGLGVPFLAAQGEFVESTEANARYPLFFLGNERRYPEIAEPVPRSHRVTGDGFQGKKLFTYLRDAVHQNKNITVHYQTWPTKLGIVDGKVVSLELNSLATAHAGVRMVHSKMATAAGYSGTLSANRVQQSTNLMRNQIERRMSRPFSVGVTGGVIIATGGFVQNPKMLKQYAPKYLHCVPSGSIGDDGSGIALAQNAGAAVSCMDHVAVHRSITPPRAMLGGVLVDRQGERVCGEDAPPYTLGTALAERGGTGFLIVDSVQMKAAKSETQLKGLSGGQRMKAAMNVLLNYEKAATIEQLASICKLPVDKVKQVIERNNLAAQQGATGASDASGVRKHARFTEAIATAPFYAINCSTDSKTWPAFCFTTGGLSVDATGTVLNTSNMPIRGLYAAGRAAAGICSGSYVHGLALADAVFTGRRSGSAAALAAMSIQK